MLELFLFILEKNMDAGRTRLTFLRVFLRAGVTYILAVAFIMTSGCRENRPAKTERTESRSVGQQPAPSLPPPLPPPTQRRAAPTPEPEALEGSGRMVWAKGLAGYFVAGMDGGLYEPYRAATIEHVQQSLRDRGLYAGPINGILDLPTMKALFEFQQANHNLQLCGIPTPRTRKLLEQGSHTDVTS